MMSTTWPLAALRFEGVGHPWLWALLILAGAGVLFWTYRGALRRAGGRLSWFLMILRGIGLLALVLALAKPTWTRESETVDPGRIAVVLDNSASMSLPDPSGKPRYALALESINKLRDSINADRSGPRMEVDLFDVNGDPIGGKPPETPAIERTDLARGVTEATAKERSKPLTGIVLVSDGMDNTGRADLRELADSPVPIFAVGFRADATTGFDLALRKVKAPERAMVHNEIKVDVTLTKTGGPATKAKVVIRRNREDVAAEAVDLPAGDSERTVRLSMTPSQAGSFVFNATVEAEAGERLTANNSAMFPLRVDAEPIRVLYLEGFLRYESKFLKNRLEDDPDVSLVSIVRRANPELADSQAGNGLLNADRLKNFDVVILGDMEASYLGDPEYRALLAWLDERNHAVLALGGYHSFGADGFRSTPLAEALPVVFADAEPYRVEEPFSLELTELGKKHPIFELSGDRARDGSAWASAPKLQGSAIVRRAKPGADVLAVDPSFSVDGQPAVVVAAQRFGGGHTMVLAADTTWRWSRLTRVAGQADTLYARFWSQTLRWLSGRSLNDQRPLLVASTDQPSYDVGKAVTLRVVRQPRPGVDLAQSEVTADVTGPDGKPLSIPLKASSAEPDVFSGTLYPSAGGRHEVAASLNAGGKALANGAAEFLVNGPGLELADPGTNRPALQSIAAATGGAYVDVEDAASLAAKFARKERRTWQERRTEYWDSPALFLAFLAAVSAEWFLRRRYHLV